MGVLWTVCPALLILRFKALVSCAVQLLRRMERPSGVRSDVTLPRVVMCSFGMERLRFLRCPVKMKLTSGLVVLRTGCSLLVLWVVRNLTGLTLLGSIM